MNFLNIFPTYSKAYIKNICFFSVFVFASTTMSVAVPGSVAAVKTIGDQIVSYSVWGLAMGGGAAFSYNAWRVSQGQPKAALYAMMGLIVSGLGFEGVFGADAKALLI